mgnify:CR=1 FL=1
MWQRGCVDRGTYGATAGDSFWQGLGNYDEPRYGTGNGEPPDTRIPSDCESWRKRVAKARKDIETWNRDVAIDARAEALTDDEFDVWFDALTKGQNEYCTESKHI